MGPEGQCRADRAHPRQRRIPVTRGLPDRVRRKLREGDLVTNTEGMLPEASFVFLDELLNANSAILNSLLMVLNERVFRRGRETRDLPLLMVVGTRPSDDTVVVVELLQ